MGFSTGVVTTVQAKSSIAGENPQPQAPTGLHSVPIGFPILEIAKE